MQLNPKILFVIAQEKFPCQIDLPHESSPYAIDRERKGAARRLAKKRIEQL